MPYVHTKGADVAADEQQTLAVGADHARIAAATIIIWYLLRQLTAPDLPEPHFSGARKLWHDSRGLQ